MASQVCLGSFGFLCSVTRGNENLAGTLPVICMCSYSFSERETRLCPPSDEQLMGGWGKASGCSSGAGGQERRRLPCGQAAVLSLCRSRRSSVPLRCGQSPRAALCSWAGHRQCLCDEREQKMAFPEHCLCPYVCWPRARKLCPHEQREGDGRGERRRGAQKQRELK